MRFSIIIPAYNAEHTIRRCVDSLLRQNCSDAEIILVNDGSQDQTGTICEEYANDYENVRYIEQKNGGVSSARNAGLDAARGEYILFVDSDDYVSENILSVLREAIESHPVDLLRFSHKTFKNEQFTQCRLTPKESAGAEMEAIIQQAICDKSLNAPWAKVYKRVLIEEKHIRFPLSLSIAEDRLFNMKYALYVQSYMALDTVGYYLNLENEQSLSRRKNDMDVQNSLYREAFEAMIIRSDGSPDRKEMVCQADHFGRCRGIYAKAKYMHREQMRFPDRVRAIRALCREFNGKRLQLPNTRYCRLVSLPIRWNLPIVIDAMAAYLVRR